MTAHEPEYRPLTTARRSTILSALSTVEALVAELADGNLLHLANFINWGAVQAELFTASTTVRYTLTTDEEHPR